MPAPTIDGRQIEIPSFRFVRDIGSGANGTVYEAHDVLLDRAVAIKLWNSHGRSRAKLETAKIAGLNHPLIVTTHSFGEVAGHPYAVMELVPGISGKAWLQSKPPVRTRVDIWRMYISALRYLHLRGVVHGDPHLGNMIVFVDEFEAHAPRDWRGNAAHAMKLADTGTSKFWSEKDDFSAREAKLIRRTAGSLFQLERFNSLTDGIEKIDYRDTLTICDALVSCLSILHGIPDRGREAQAADGIVDIVVSTPFFNLDELFRQVFASPMTTRDRLARRLNGTLLGLTEPWRGSEDFTCETRRLYRNRKLAWLSDHRT